VSQETDISDRTIRKWQADDKDFQALVAKLRHRMYTEVLGRLTALGNQSVEVLQALLSSPNENVRRQTAEYVLDHIKIADIEAAKSEIQDMLDEIKERTDELERKRKEPPPVRPWTRPTTNEEAQRMAAENQARRNGEVGHE
jgi:hypothetical protein